MKFEFDRQLGDCTDYGETMRKQPSESAVQLVELVQQYIGCSLDNRCDELGQLVSRDVDDPKTIVEVTTNCGMFALGIWHAMGVPHELLQTPYVNERAIGWIMAIAHDFGAIRYPKRDGLPAMGSLMHYWVRQGTRTVNHHVEFCLSTPDAHGNAKHAGGGRSHNAITASVSDVKWGASGPLQAWYDIDDLLDGTN